MEKRIRLYEGMFLLDPSFGSRWDDAQGEVERVLGRAGAEVLACVKWDERKLAYEIEGRRRGLYVLTYFKAGTDRIGGIERDVQLSEHVLRVLVMHAEHTTEEKIQELVERKEAVAKAQSEAAAARAPAPAAPAEAEAKPASEAPVEAPVEAPAEAPVEAPAEVPADAPAETPVGDAPDAPQDAGDEAAEKTEG